MIEPGIVGRSGTGGLESTGYVILGEGSLSIDSFQECLPVKDSLLITPSEMIWGSLIRTITVLHPRTTSMDS